MSEAWRNRKYDVISYTTVRAWHKTVNLSFLKVRGSLYILWEKNAKSVSCNILMISKYRHVWDWGAWEARGLYRVLVINPVWIQPSEWSTGTSEKWEVARNYVDRNPPVVRCLCLHTNTHRHILYSSRHIDMTYTI